MNDSEKRPFLPERRTGDDRRTGAERRSGVDRRDRLGIIDLAVEAERRRLDDRRVRRDRRATRERRRPSTAQFSWKDTVRIHKLLADATRDAACPRCQGRLLLGPLEFTEGVTTREVHCTGCRYSVAISEDT